MIKGNKRILFFLFFFIFSKCLTQDNFEINKYKNKIEKDYYKLLLNNGLLIDEANNYCSTNKKKTENLEKKFFQLLNSWTSVQHIRFGPVEDFNNYLRIQFWPDKRNVIARQYEKVIRNKPSEYTDFTSLGMKSVAIQGIPVLEKIIFDELNTHNVNDRTFVCNYMKAILKNLEAMFLYTHSIWKNEADFFENIDEDQLLSLFYNSILSQLEIIMYQKIMNTSKKNQKYSKKKLEFWRSNYSWDSILNNMGSIYEFYSIVLKPLLAKAKYPKLSDFENNFKMTLIFLNDISCPIEKEKNIKQLNVNLEKAYLKVKALHSSLLIDVSEVLSISIGFNKLDGD